MKVEIVLLKWNEQQTMLDNEIMMEREVTYVWARMVRKTMEEKYMVKELMVKQEDRCCRFKHGQQQVLCEDDEFQPEDEGRMKY